MEVLNWFNDQEELNLKKKKLKKFESANESEIIEFFKNTDVKVCSLFGLLERVKDREDIMRKNLNSQHKRLLREIKNRRDLIREKDNLILNFAELEYPQIFWQAQSNLNLKRQLLTRLDLKKINDFQNLLFLDSKHPNLL